MLAPASVSDYRILAKRKLPRMLFDYLDGGAFSEHTLAENRQAFTQWSFRQRVMQDVAQVDTSTTLLGAPASLPLVMAPMGLAGMLAKRGEVQAAGAGARAGVPFCLSTVGICSVEEVAKDVPNADLWFQLYVLKDRGFSAELLQRAWQAGFKTLVFTVDLARLGLRYRDVRNGMNGNLSFSAKIRKALDLLGHPRWLADVPIGGKPLTFGNLASAVPSGRKLEDFKAWVESQFDPSVTWSDLDWIRQNWPGKLIIKGIMEVDDALSAVEVGADAVVVSNHGGRQLDGAPASLSVLPAIAETVAGKCQVFVDGGVQSGQDLVRALCLGADGCLMGRPWGYALAAGGQAAVESLLDNIRLETELTLSLMGKTALGELSRSDLLSLSEVQAMARLGG
ncbi:L-lactate dehydrogenase [Marinobacter sp.]|uniref:L-lactate dehydrogenase n=1 Tax=Marinobacter sp. TaxID=50741 RepID=UPI002B27490F|nr:L-lactate dehydrogenase [Marinobacter sp.]